MLHRPLAQITPDIIILVDAQVTMRIAAQITEVIINQTIVDAVMFHRRAAQITPDIIVLVDAFMGQNFTTDVTVDIAVQS